MHSMRNLAVLILLSVAAFGQGAAPTGSVAGTIFDSTTGQPIRQAKVDVEGQPGKSATSDLDGRYKIELPAGTYRLRFSAENYSETSVAEVVVTAGEPVEASIVMSNKAAVTAVDVVEKVGAVQATAEALLSERKLSGVVSDSISGEEIKATTASSAAGAVEKVTGVSIVDNGFVYVRGLGERYSSTMLNSAMIPTTEPEKRVVPLDLFPAALIDNIKILKTYTPDLPGEFAGGLVQMNTVEFPTARILRVSTSYGFNTRTTFDRFLTYPGGSRDALGFDDGTRNLPSVIPRDQRLFPGRFTTEQFRAFGQSFANNWEPTANDSMRPTQSYSVVGGDTFGRLGLVGAVSFSNKPQRYSELQRYYRNAGGGNLFLFTNYPEFDADGESARIGAVLNAALRLNQTNKLVIRNTLTRDTDKESRVFRGYDGTIDANIESQRLRWVERGLMSTSIEGEHNIPKWRSLLARWQFTYSKSNRDEPDLREVVRTDIGNGRYAYTQTAQSGLRFFNELADEIYEPQADVSVPFYRGSFAGMFKTGFRGTIRRRDFSARRFQFLPGRSANTDFTQPSNTLFGPDNLRAGTFQILETTRGTDRYDAEMDVYGAFAMVDMSIGPRWRFVGGLRYEDANIKVLTIDPFVPGAVPVTANLSNRDPLMGINAIYALTSKQNVRLSYSRTVSRPDFRELSPFEFTNVVGGVTVVGNPNLRRATIQNFDARWEWFFGGRELIAASYFLKQFKDPIEVTIQATSDFRQSFLNAEGARNQGFELEYRRGLGSFHPSLAQFAFQGNFTFVDSNIDIPRDQIGVLTSQSRPLVGQSRFIYNAGIEWMRPQWRSNARFYANSVARRITDVGTYGLPDIYQERNTFLDFVYQVDVVEGGRTSFRFSAENLGDNTYRWTQGGLTSRQFQLGRTYTAGLSISIF